MCAKDRKSSKPIPVLVDDGTDELSRLTTDGPEDQRMAAFLRVYPSCVEDECPETPPATVSVRLADLLPLVALAHRQNYLWLQDFLDDEVIITEDLHEVLCAFRCTRPSA